MTKIEIQRTKDSEIEDLGYVGVFDFSPTKDGGPAIRHIEFGNFNGRQAR